ncbi:hypothetical protein HF521_001811 [Silurus meridionalis]|uniref:Ig-like domain-containing protein n=1 Tax=Silurus meridionalis TaxID=175797 RepID=A0A8T0BCF8_SILME|nr:hypothetical protein HF521_001811 [Silurus meridionalis]
MILLSISIFWLSVCVDPISADPPITVEAHVGSTALLPCTLSKDFTQTSVIRWRAYIEVVFERSIDGTHEGAGYKGRVDVPEDELRKGNCSLVLKDVRITDHAFYTSFVLEHIDAPDTNKIQEINGVQLDDPISADPPITVKAHVGFTALLPCSLSKDFSKTPHVRWRADNEIVVEKSFDGTHKGRGYEGRVDVPEDELRKGNCSLVLKDIRITDHTFYTYFMVEHAEATNTDKATKINRVQLNVFQSVSAQVGSTAVLPCDWRHLSIQTPHVEWRIGDEIVFERLGKESFQGEGYEGRVDIPEEELLKGNCSLVLKDVRITDQTLYSSYILMMDTKKPVLVQNIKLSVSDPISADPHITVEAHVGSTALLPCSLSKDFSKTPHVRWRADNEFVFERSFDGTHEGPGYKGRVDVPEDELRKGNCSLVLKDVRITDHVFYRSFVMEHVEATNTNKIQEINRVQLNVFQRVSAQVGSTAVLPCDWRYLSIQTPHVEWRIGNETVFERLGKESSQGKGYEGRVDVPEEELLKGNCSLVLKNVSVTDETLYSSYILMTDTKKPVLVQNIKLSVRELSEERKDDSSAPSGEADGMNLLIIITVCIMCSVLLIFIAIFIWMKYRRSSS